MIKTAKHWRNLLLLRPWQRHSLVLMVGGIVYLCIGIAMTTVDLKVEQKRAITLALHMAPIHIWGLVFVMAGLLAMLSSRWPTFSITWGYMVLTGLSLAWGSTYLLGGLVLHAPIANVVSGLVWVLMGFLWWGISGLLNPPIKGGPDDGRH